MATIERGPLPSDNFVILSNDWVRDVRLSWRARGLLAWLSSHSVSFKVSEARITAASEHDGRHTVREALAELESLGYLTRTKDHGVGGRFTSATYRLQDPIVRSTDNGSADDGSTDSGQIAPHKKTSSSKKTENDEDQLLTPPSSADDVIEAEFIDEKQPTAQTLIAEWVDSRGPNDPPNSQVLGRVASTLKRLLNEGVPYDKVRLGFATWAHSGYSIGALASYVDNAGKAPQRHTQQQETDDKFARAMARADAGQNVFGATAKELTA